VNGWDLLSAVLQSILETLGKQHSPLVLEVLP